VLKLRQNFKGVENIVDIFCRDKAHDTRLVRKTPEYSPLPVDESVGH